MIIRYIAAKILYSISILWGVATLVFLIFNVIPGDPARMTLGQRSDSASLVAVRADLGLDKPLTIQYTKYLNDLSPLSLHNYVDKRSFFYLDPKVYHPYICLVRWDKHVLVLKFPYLRRSYQQQRNVSEMIQAALPATLVLAFFSIILASFLGVTFGILAAWKRNTWIDRTMLTLSSFGIAMPSFFVAIIFAWLFAYVLGSITHLPLTGSLYEWDDLGNGRYLALKNVILPALTLGIRPLAVVMQLMRNSLIEVLSLEYITTARAKGLSEKQVIFRHALRNALNPVVTSLSSWFASMLAGVVFIEYIFSWKGMGYLIVNALQDFDLPVVMGGVLVIAVIFIIVNILTDITYAILDPRVRFEK
ncbi:MAG: ABC transporter permease [Bacteroidales bacterium]|nr:ABC transporter permease [Bacteroidales bacterium]